MESIKQETFARERYLLQVDGVGCLMLLPAERVTIGGVEGADLCDVTLRTTGLESPITVDRQADRYLARARSPFRVNDRTGTSKLLLSGDTIEIGRRGRLRFLKPVAASATALLRPTAAPLARSDIRHVVLLQESLLFGPTGTHLPIPHCRDAIVLSHLDERFSLRPLHQAANSAASLSVNEPVRVQDVQFVLRRLEAQKETLHDVV